MEKSNRQEWMKTLGKAVAYFLAIYIFIQNYGAPIASIKLYQIVILVIVLFSLLDDLLRETEQDIENVINKNNEDMCELIRNKVSEIEDKIDELNKQDEIDE